MGVFQKRGKGGPPVSSSERGHLARFAACSDKSAPVKETRLEESRFMRRSRFFNLFHFDVHLFLPHFPVAVDELSIHDPPVNAPTTFFA